MSDQQTVVDLLEARLRQLGVERIYGQSLGGLQHVSVDDPDLALLLADADGRLGHWDGSGRLGAALVDGPILHLSSCPGGMSPVYSVSTIDDVLDALADPPGISIPGTMALHLDLDLGEPATAASTDAALRREPERVPVMTLDPSMESMNIIIVVGPGVVRSSSLEGLRSFARTGGYGIINTWGAKGVERWDSPFHFGTVGLQAFDLELAGLTDADLVIVSGLDPAEVKLEDFGPMLIQDVPATQLGALATGWKHSRDLPTRPPLYETISAVLTPMFESEAVPLSAPRAALHLSGALPERGVVVSDPGAAGFWIARSLPTSFPGSVCVPGTFTAGFAAAAGLVCSLERRPCLAVTDQIDGPDGIDETSAAILELAESLGQPVALQVWGDGGNLANSTAHVELLAEQLKTDHVRIDDIPVQVDDLDELETAAGPLIAWQTRADSISDDDDSAIV